MAHPATAHIPKPWKIVDEFYNYNPYPKGKTVLMRLNETTYNGGGMGADHPIAWSSENATTSARMFYTGLGHTSQMYEEPFFKEHMLKGILWASKLI